MGPWFSQPYSLYFLFWLFSLSLVPEEMNFQTDTYSGSQSSSPLLFWALGAGVIFGSLCVKTSWLAVCSLMLMGAWQAIASLISHFEVLNVRSSINIFIIAFLLCSYLGYRCVGANIPSLLCLMKKRSTNMINSYTCRLVFSFLTCLQVHINLRTSFSFLFTQAVIPRLYRVLCVEHWWRIYEETIH